MSALQLSGFGACFGHRVILSSVDLSLPVQGIDVRMGPLKTDQSTLMRTLAGLNTTTANHSHWESAQLAQVARWMRDGSPRSFSATRRALQIFGARRGARSKRVRDPRGAR